MVVPVVVPVVAVAVAEGVANQCAAIADPALKHLTTYVVPRMPPEANYEVREGSTVRWERTARWKRARGIEERMAWESQGLVPTELFCSSSTFLVLAKPFHKDHTASKSSRAPFEKQVADAGKCYCSAVQSQAPRILHPK